MNERPPDRTDEDQPTEEDKKRMRAKMVGDKDEMAAWVEAIKKGSANPTQTPPADHKQPD